MFPLKDSIRSVVFRIVFRLLVEEGKELLFEIVFLVEEGWLTDRFRGFGMGRFWGVRLGFFGGGGGLFCVFWLGVWEVA